jgi:hypothetical protein
MSICTDQTNMKSGFMGLMMMIHLHCKRKLATTKLKFDLLVVMERDNLISEH